MNRLHVHLKVSDLDQSIAFYSALFAQEPNKREADYAKWLLEDPPANIAISTRGAAPGIDHVGLQAGTSDDLGVIAARLKVAGVDALAEPDTTCCYSRSDKYWALSPDGAKWELFHTFADSTSFSAGPAPEVPAKAASRACCGA